MMILIMNPPVHRPMMKKTPLVCHDSRHFCDRWPQKNPRTHPRMSADVLRDRKRNWC